MLESESDGSGYGSNSSLEETFPISLVHSEIEDPKTRAKWQFYVNEFLCNTNTNANFCYHLIQYLFFKNQSNKKVISIQLKNSSMNSLLMISLTPHSGSFVVQF